MRNQITTCMHCGKPLRNVDKIHCIEGELYCSKECAINAQVAVIMASAYDTATKWYDDGAETVSPDDIGVSDEDIVDDTAEDIDDPVKCSWCDLIFDRSDLLETDMGLMCPDCVNSIRNHGENIVVFEGGN